MEHNTWHMPQALSKGPWVLLVEWLVSLPQAMAWFASIQSSHCENEHIRHGAHIVWDIHLEDLTHIHLKDTSDPSPTVSEGISVFVGVCRRNHSTTCSDLRSRAHGRPSNVANHSHYPPCQDCSFGKDPPLHHGPQDSWVLVIALPFGKEEGGLKNKVPQKLSDV